MEDQKLEQMELAELKNQRAIDKKNITRLNILLIITIIILTTCLIINLM